MKVLIFEDEALTAERLINLLKKHDPGIEVLGVLQTVKSGIKWFKTNSLPDLVFMDIHLADGSGFEILSNIKVDVPVIFTTAYDKYAIQAFKVNSIDYLLKPIDFNELKNAISKFNSLIGKPQLNGDTFKYFIDKMANPYKQRFLIKSGDIMKFVNTTDIAYFVFDEDYVYAYKTDSKHYIIDDSIEKLEKLLNPNDFFRINRKMIISLQSIVDIHKYFNGRVKLKLKPDIQFDAIVSREKTSDFKKWLNK